jgi:hypothetical protein
MHVRAVETIKMMMAAILLLWIALVVLVLWGLNWLFPAWHAAKHGLHDDQDPMESLALRYVQGKITSEEYQSLRHDLRESGEVRVTHMLSEPLAARSDDPHADESHDTIHTRGQDESSYRNRSRVQDAGRSSNSAGQG